MPQERITELRESLFHLEKRIKPLEWDASRNQINEFKLEQLKRMQGEFVELQKELKELEKQESS